MPIYKGKIKVASSEYVPKATKTTLGVVKPGDGLEIDEDGTLKTKSNVTVDEELSNTSVNPVQNKTITAELDKKASKTVATTSADGLLSSADKTKLDKIENEAEKNVQSDWNETNSTVSSFIANKPTSLPASDVSSWAKEKTKPTYTKSEIGLENVPNVTTNNQTPTYSDTTELATLSSGETLSSAFSKIKLAISNLINHLADKTTHITSDERSTWNNKASSNTATASSNGLMSSTDKTKLDGIETGANKITVDSSLSSTSTNPVQNKVINTALAGKASSTHTHSYLPLSGGTMTGDIKRNGNAVVNTGTNGSTNFSGGTNLSDGANLVLRGKNQNGIEGFFQLTALSDSGGVTLLGKPNGSLTWGSSTILRSDNYSNYALPLSGGTITGQIKKAGVSSSWYNGRDNCALAITSLNGYSPAISEKTNNGSWELATYNNANFSDKLIFSYITDSSYSTTTPNAATAQITFTSSGDIESTNGLSLTKLDSKISIADSRNLVTSNLLWANGHTVTNSKFTVMNYNCEVIGNYLHCKGNASGPYITNNTGYTVTFEVCMATANTGYIQYGYGSTDGSLPNYQNTGAYREGYTSTTSNTAGQIFSYRVPNGKNFFFGCNGGYIKYIRVREQFREHDFFITTDTSNPIRLERTTADAECSIIYKSGTVTWAVGKGVSGTTSNFAWYNSVKGKVMELSTNGNLTVSSINGKAFSTAGTTSVFNTIPTIGSDGVMEVGKYIDFHSTANNTADYDVRITATTDGLTFSNNLYMGSGKSLYGGDGKRLIYQDGGSSWFGANTKDKPTYIATSDYIHVSRSAGSYVGLDSGNYSSYALPLSGGTMTGSLLLGTNKTLTFTNNNTSDLSYINIACSVGKTSHSIAIGETSSSGYALLRPSTDLGVSLGTSTSYRWRYVYAQYMYISSGTAVTSDRNYKNTINDLNDELTYKFTMGLKPSSFKYNESESDRLHYGFIAQDVEENMHTLGMNNQDFAGLVIENYNNDEEESSYALRYDEFIAPIVKTLQMQDKKICELEKEIKELNDKIITE